MRALIAEDDPVARRVLSRGLANLGVEVTTTDNGQEAWSILSAEDAPDLAILAWTLTDPGALELCRRVRSLDRRKYTYLLVTTSPRGQAEVLAAFDAGADDCLSKTIEPREFQARMQAAHRLISKGTSLVEQATRDGLTGVWNAQAIRDLLQSEVARARRTGRSVAAIMVDIDHFKQVNDRYGHLAGDRILKELCGRMTALLRPYDTVGRLGGDELLVVLPDPQAQGAKAVADRLLQAICQIPVALETSTIPCTASLGVAVATALGDLDAEHLLSRADQALYEAKRAGRKRVHVA